MTREFISFALSDSEVFFISEPASDATSSGIDSAIDERLVEGGDLRPSLLVDRTGGGNAVLDVVVTGGWAGIIVVKERLWSFSLIGLVELERLETGGFLTGVVAVPTPKPWSPDEDEDIIDILRCLPSAEFVREGGPFCRTDGTGLVVFGAALRPTTAVRPLTEVGGLTLVALALALRVFLGCSIAVPERPLSFCFAAPDSISDIVSLASLPALSTPCSFAQRSTLEERVEASAISLNR